MNTSFLAGMSLLTVAILWAIYPGLVAAWTVLAAGIIILSMIFRR